jgi:metal-responsive CopG/Arc/MetJ family transcriptional regulator
MRTTVEIPDELRAKLLEEAARRGEKGFSGLIQEALDQYFASASDREARVTRAVESLGSLAGTDGEALEKDVENLRRTWR